MILTRDEITKKVRFNEIVIEPFSLEFVEPNSYGFHLGETILMYSEPVIDSRLELTHTRMEIPESGLTLEPDHFYLGHTYEKIGGLNFASELYANLSTAAAGMFIQTSAPLGHTGAVINWTLEIVVAQPIVVYPRMKIGKICFWTNFGKHIHYSGRYQQSDTVVASRIAWDEK